jgi:hypothetical protein
VFAGRASGGGDVPKKQLSELQKLTTTAGDIKGTLTGIRLAVERRGATFQ